MNEQETSHAPSPLHPDDAVTLGRGARVRDVGSSGAVDVQAWLAARSEREGRPIEECREDLMNEIARGDVRVEDAGTGA